jgi:hypothetical protein
MRQLQRNPNTAKNPNMNFRLIRAEAEVDECIGKKLEEWARHEQPELGSHQEEAI